ncbi:V-type proton ATPase subunit E-like isoform X1 [Lycorma delicatula]|uniref:V-type proton ATPase subunit E-like isoform X1 n=2 Tax=Lycorma delicatula TaxID=130591 RepID=UPI003F518A21
MLQAFVMVNRMVAFIELEGLEKAEAISNKTEEEYHLTVGNMVQNGRRQLVELYDKKIKSMYKENNLKEQLLTTQSKMKLLKHRQEVVDNLLDEAFNKLIKKAEDEENNRDILQKCMLQAFVMMLEKDIIIQVVERDKNIVKDIVPKVQEQYEKITGIKARVKIAKKTLSNNCVGGCITFNKRCTLKVTNTISERFRIILDRVVSSVLRTMLFGNLKS